jgi:hypothetical protein
MFNSPNGPQKQEQESNFRVGSSAQGAKFLRDNLKGREAFPAFEVGVPIPNVLPFQQSAAARTVPFDQSANATRSPSTFAGLHGVPSFSSLASCVLSASNAAVMRGESIFILCPASPLELAAFWEHAPFPSPG